MHYPIRHSLILVSALLLAGFAAGCVTVVKPISTDGSHGLLVGHVRLAWEGIDQTEGHSRPMHMMWSIEEVIQGKRFSLAELPTTGPFLVQLPVGSYRLKDIMIDGLPGLWHPVGSITFLVQSTGCTSLGTWVLERETNLLTDWITGRAFTGLEPTHVDLQQVLAALDCPMLEETTVRSTVGFQNRLYPWP